MARISRNESVANLVGTLLGTGLDGIGTGSTTAPNWQKNWGQTPIKKRRTTLSQRRRDLETQRTAHREPSARHEPGISLETAAREAARSVPSVSPNKKDPGALRDGISSREESSAPLRSSASSALKLFSAFLRRCGESCSTPFPTPNALTVPIRSIPSNPFPKTVDADQPSHYSRPRQDVDTHSTT
jgi:hypothetical protein